MLLLTAATLVSKTLLGPVQNQAKSSTMISLVHNNEIISKGYKMIVFDKDGEFFSLSRHLSSLFQMKSSSLIQYYIPERHTR